MAEDVEAKIADLKDLLFGIGKYDPKVEPTPSQRILLNCIRILESLTESERRDLENGVVPSRTRALEICKVVGVSFARYERTINTFVYNLPRVQRKGESFSEAYIADLKHSALYWTLNPKMEGSPRSGDQFRILESLSREENEALQRGDYPSKARCREICRRLKVKAVVCDQTLEFFASCARRFRETGVVSHIMSTNDGPMFEAFAGRLSRKHKFQTCKKILALFRKGHKPTQIESIIRESPLDEVDACTLVSISRSAIIAMHEMRNGKAGASRKVRLPDIVPNWCDADFPGRVLKAATEEFEGSDVNNNVLLPDGDYA